MNHAGFVPLRCKDPEPRRVRGSRFPGTVPGFKPAEGMCQAVSPKRPVLLAFLAIAPALAGCAQPEPGPVPGENGPAREDCPSSGEGFLALAVQEGGLAPHPEVYTLQAGGLATGIVLASGQPGNGSAVGVPDRALHNVSADEVRRLLQAADVPDEGRWNVTMAFQGRATDGDLEAVCSALHDRAPELAASYPDEDCRDGTTLSLTLWTPEGVTVSQAHCEGGQGTAFEDVRLTLRNATATARERSGAPG